MAESSFGAVAQLGERLVCNQEATGSIPVSSTNKPSQVVRSTSCELVEEMTHGMVHEFGSVCCSSGRHHCWRSDRDYLDGSQAQERIAMIERGIDPDAPRRQ